MMTLALLAAGPAALPGPSSHLGWFAGMPVAIPEVSSLALLIVGLAAVGVAARRRQARVLAEPHREADEA